MEDLAADYGELETRPIALPKHSKPRPIRDVTGTTTWHLEVDNPLHPESAFMSGSNGVTVEFDREALREYAKRVWGLVDPFEVMYEAPPAVRKIPTVCMTCPFSSLLT
jgi:hypothetical protein